MELINAKHTSTCVSECQAISSLFGRLFALCNIIDDILLFFFHLTVQIDSVMSTRHANENEASRRLKSEFLVQFDGVTSNSTDLVIVIGKLW